MFEHQRSRWFFWQFILLCVWTFLSWCLFNLVSIMLRMKLIQDFVPSFEISHARYFGRSNSRLLRKSYFLTEMKQCLQHSSLLDRVHHDIAVGYWGSRGTFGWCKGWKGWWYKKSEQGAIALIHLCLIDYVWIKMQVHENIFLITSCKRVIIAIRFPLQAARQICMGNLCPFFWHQKLSILQGYATI